MDGIGVFKPGCDASDLAVDFGVDVALRLAALLVQDRRLRLHCGDRIEHGGQDFVIDHQRPTSRFGGGLRLGDDRGDALADEAHDIVEHVGVVGIDEVVLVRRRAVKLARHVLPGENFDHARNSQRRAAIDAADAGMRVRRAQHFEVQQVLDGHIHRVARVPGDDPLAERIAQDSRRTRARPRPLRRSGCRGSRHRSSGSRCSGTDFPSARAARSPRCSSLERGDWS